MRFALCRHRVGSVLCFYFVLVLPVNLFRRMTRRTSRICSRSTTGLGGFSADRLSIGWNVDIAQGMTSLAYPSKDTLFSFRVFLCLGKPCLSQLPKLFQESILSLCYESKVIGKDGTHYGFLHERDKSGQEEQHTVMANLL